MATTRVIGLSDREVVELALVRRTIPETPELFIGSEALARMNRNLRGVI